jgi:hypothetical protein
MFDAGTRAIGVDFCRWLIGSCCSTDDIILRLSLVCSANLKDPNAHVVNELPDEVLDPWHDASTNLAADGGDMQVRRQGRSNWSGTG